MIKRFKTGDSVKATLNDYSWNGIILKFLPDETDMDSNDNTKEVLVWGPYGEESNIVPINQIKHHD